MQAWLGLAGVVMFEVIAFWGGFSMLLIFKVRDLMDFVR